MIPSNLDLMLISLLQSSSGIFDVSILRIKLMGFFQKVKVYLYLSGSHLLWVRAIMAYYRVVKPYFIACSPSLSLQG